MRMEEGEGERQRIQRSARSAAPKACVDVKVLGGTRMAMASGGGHRALHANVLGKRMKTAPL